MNEPAQTLPPFASFDDFAAWEDQQQDGRYEYAAGHAVAMSGASMRHNALASRVQSLLSAQLKPGCIALAEGQRIEALNSESRWYYADGSVLCSDPELTRDKALSNPSVLIEVLSRSSESRDRGEKWLSYQQLVSLQDCILVSQQTVQIEHYTRDAKGWLYRAAQGQAGSIKLASGVELALADVYAGVMHLPAD